MSIRPLSPELQKIANEELNEVPSRIQDDLKHINEWLQKQPHLKIRTDDQWLISFLRGCKFSLQRTKEKLDYFYTMRSLVPEFFANRDPLSDDIQRVLNAGAIFVLPKAADPVGPRVLVFRWEVCDVEKITVVTILKVFFMAFDILMKEDDNVVVSGIKVWAEYRNFPVNYILQLTPGVMKKAIVCMQSAYPIRIKAISCTNTPSVFEIIFNMCKQFMTEKLVSRMAIYSESHFPNFYKDVPKSLLPTEYGGENGKIDDIAAQFKKKVESYREWFLEDEKYRSDENLRLGQPVTTAAVFGMEGTFRKLVID